KTTVQRHVKEIEIPPIFLKRLKERQGGAKQRAKGLRENCFEEATGFLGELSKRDYLILLIGLYWGEGTKRDFSIINSDPKLLQTFMVCLRAAKIDLERISLSLRVHSDISIHESKKFWSSSLGVPIERIGRIEVIEGKKKGKLAHGMCRIRVLSGIRERLLIQSSIELIGKEAAEKVLSL
ncbi:MAG: hypothetical protein Q8S35_01675, partial [bacterium]|nr:hypothetical protein [bacterium]